MGVFRDGLDSAVGDRRTLFILVQPEEKSFRIEILNNFAIVKILSA